MQVTARINKSTGRPEIFFYNRNPRGFWLEVYDGSHSECELTYMRYCTRSPNSDAESQACNDLFDQWCGLPGHTDDHPRLVKRLTR